MREITGRFGAAARITALMAMVLAASSAPSRAQTFSVLYTFTGGTDGAYPNGSLIGDSTGHLYGATGGGGGSSACTVGCGTVFTVDLAGHETVLYRFTGGTDGSGPLAGVVRDSAGNLYGTADGGGAFGAGVVFQLNPAGNETVLHSFSGRADGGNPLAGLGRTAAGNLYGTTASGGTGDGVVFKLDSIGDESLVHIFTGIDGDTPEAGLLRDSSGNFYGTTFLGGRYYNDGTVFKLDPAGNESVLYSFAGNSDGANPAGGLVQDQEGNLYGTTVYTYSQSAGSGVVFRLDPTGHETVLHTFTGVPDGSYPYVGLVRDVAGNLYGTTVYGGAYDFGTVFVVGLNGKEKVLYSFTGGTDGWLPFSPLLPYQGALYGTTNKGGVGYGLVFKITLP